MACKTCSETIVAGPAITEAGQAGASAAHPEDRRAFQTLGDTDCSQLLSPQACPLLCGSAALSPLACLWLLLGCGPGRPASKTYFFAHF